MLHCNRGQTDFQRWMVKNEIAGQKAVDAWLDFATPRPDPAGEDVAAEVQRLRETASDRLRTAARQTYVGAPAGLETHVNAIGLSDATAAMTEAAVESVWRTAWRAWLGLLPISDNLAVLMALVVNRNARLSWSLSSRKVWTSQHLLLISYASFSSLCSMLPSQAWIIRAGRARLGPDRSLPRHVAKWMSMKATGCRMRTLARKASLTRTKISFGSTTKINAIGFVSPTKASSWRKNEENPRERARKKSKGGKSRKRRMSGKTCSSSASKANIAAEEEDAEEETRLAEKKRRNVRNQRRRAIPSQRHQLRVRLMRSMRRSWPTVLYPYMILWLFAKKIGALKCAKEGEPQIICSKGYPMIRLKCCSMPVPSVSLMANRLLQREAPDMVFTQDTSVHRLLHYWWRRGALSHVSSTDEESGRISRPTRKELLRGLCSTTQGTTSATSS